MKKKKRKKKKKKKTKKKEKKRRKKRRKKNGYSRWKYSGMQHCALGGVDPDVSKVCNAFMFEVKQSRKTKMLRSTKRP
jgi:hypothetical protein